jgi:uncharacterized protein
MTGLNTPPLSNDFDDVWRPGHLSDHRGRNTLSGFFVVVLLAAFVWNWFAKVWLPSTAWVPANIAITVCLVAVARGKGMSWAELGMRRDRLTRGFVVGIVAAAAILLVLAIGVALSATRPFFEDAQVAADTVGYRFFNQFVRIPLGTVVLEETLFRGLLMALALRRWSVVTAVFVTSAIFGLWHIVPITGSTADLLDVILSTVAVTTIGGVLFAWLRLRANSILAPMLAHVATNSLGYLAAVIALQLR